MRSGGHYKWVPLEELGEVQQGATLSRFRHEGGNSLRVIQIRNLDKLEVASDLEEEKYLGEKVATYRVEVGQVLVSLRANPVKASVVPEPLKGCLAGSNLAIVKPRQDVDPYYLAGLIRSDFINRRLSNLIGGTVIPSLSVAVLRKAELPAVSAEYQSLLADAFRALDNYATLAAKVTERRGVRLEAQLEALFGESNAR